MQYIKPKMVILLMSENISNGVDGLKGTKAVLENCVHNPFNVTAEEIQALADDLNREIGRYDPEKHHLNLLEVHNHPFQNYLYDYFHIKVMVSPLELETVFWDAAAPAQLTDGIAEFLDFLQINKIRTGVISNISISGSALKNRINHFLPNNKFEFIIASSEYMFRKPNKRIFEMALKKASLQPNEVWYCGDNIKCDIEGTHKCGIIPVWYTGAINKGANQLNFDFYETDNWMKLAQIIR